MNQSSNFELPDDIELENPEAERVGDVARASVIRFAQPPAAEPVAPKDPDKALANVALGLLRLNGWPCQEEPGYRSFKVTVKYRSAARGVIDTDQIHIFAQNGLLYFEQVVLELPSLPGIPILEAINEINQRSLSSVFVVCSAGVLQRHALVPRSPDDGFFSAKMITLTIRQMYHDRRHALSFLRQVVETGKIEPMVVRRTFAQPAAPNALPSLDQEGLIDLAEFASFVAHRNGPAVLLDRQLRQPEKCPVLLTAHSTHILAQIVVGHVGNVQSLWKYVPAKVRQRFSEAAGFLNPNDLLRRVNLANREPGLLRFVVVDRSIVAQAVLYPIDDAITVEQFRTFADQLLQTSNAASSGLLRMVG